MQVTCLYCGKKYSIDTARIPPGVKTINCAACGRPVSLLKARSSPAAVKTETNRKAAQLKPPTVEQNPTAAADSSDVKDTDRPVNPNRRNRKVWTFFSQASIFRRILQEIRLATDINPEVCTNFISALA